MSGLSEARVRELAALIAAHVDHMETYTIPACSPDWLKAWDHALRLFRRDAGFIASTALAPLVAGWLAEAWAERDALAAAVDRVRRRHPRGDEESGYLAPGLWCPTCGHERQDGGYGGCPDRQALIIPGQPVRGPVARGGAR